MPVLESAFYPESLRNVTTEQSNKKDLAQKPLTVGQQRCKAAQLREANYSYSEIAKIMQISPVRARDLCRQFNRFAAVTATGFEFELSRRALFSLLTGTNASKFASDIEARLPLLVDIAASYTRKELSAEENVGPRTLAEIEVWLASKGRSLRKERSRLRAIR